MVLSSMSLVGPILKEQSWDVMSSCFQRAQRERARERARERERERERARESERERERARQREKESLRVGIQMGACAFLNNTS